MKGENPSNVRKWERMKSKRRNSKKFKEIEKMKEIETSWKNRKIDKNIGKLERSQIIDWKIEKSNKKRKIAKSQSRK